MFRNAPRLAAIGLTLPMLALAGFGQGAWSAETDSGATGPAPPLVSSVASLSRPEGIPTVKVATGELRVEAPDSCPKADELASRVGKHLRATAALVPSASTPSLAMRITAPPHRGHGASVWTGVVQALDASSLVVGSRTISRRGETCTGIADALVLVAALLLSSPPDAYGKDAASLPVIPSAAEPSRQGGEPAPSAPSNLPAAASHRTVPPPPPAPAQLPSKKDNPLFAEVEGKALAGRGPLPVFSGAGGFRLALVFSAWARIYVGFDYWPRTRLSSSADLGAEVGLWRSGIGICPWRLAFPKQTIDMCLGANAGRLRASGLGFDQVLSSEIWTVDLTLGGQIAQLIARGFYLGLGVEGVMPITRSRVAYRRTDGQSQVIDQAWPIGVVGFFRLGRTFL